MPNHVLITGGAGFIGSHLADQLIGEGRRVRVLDELTPQVHGPGRERPSYLHPDVELVVGDVRDREKVAACLAGVDTVFHLAARIGVGQSMYQMADYASVNTSGTAVLLEELVRCGAPRLVVASSMSVYGEGLYRTAGGRVVEGAPRTLEQLRAGDFEPRGPDGEALSPVPTHERKTPSLESVYALSKYDQELLCLLAGRAYGLGVTALRFFNVYGPRQALSNPYTGVLANFAVRLLNDAPPLIFEDGLQRRDFVSVHDAARALRLAARTPAAAGRVLNVASGRSFTVREVAAHMAEALGRPGIAPELTGKCRMGDVRHCFADITAAREVLGYAPRVSLEDGLVELCRWLDGQKPADHVAEARAELSERGLSL